MEEKVNPKQLFGFTLINCLIILAGVTAYFLLSGLIYATNLGWLEEAEAGSVYFLQKSFGIPVNLTTPTKLTYSVPPDTFDVSIVSACIGLGEILFLCILILVFRGVDLRVKLKGVLIFAPIMFIVNFIRLLSLYHLAVSIGVDAMWNIHYVFWKYGQFFIILFLFSLWYLLMARKDICKALGKKNRRHRFW